MNFPIKTTQNLEGQSQTLADIVLILDERGLILDCKSDNLSLPAPSPNGLLNKNVRELLSSDTEAGFERQLNEAWSNKQVIPLEFSLPVNGLERWYDARLVSESASRFILSARDVTKYKETEIRMERQLKRLSALRSIDLAIASGLELNLLLSVLLDRVTETLHVDAASILLLDLDLNELRYATGKGFYTNSLQHTRLKPGQ